jgi:hypothetical protein
MVKKFGFLLKVIFRMEHFKGGYPVKGLIHTSSEILLGIVAQKA